MYINNNYGVRSHNLENQNDDSLDIDTGGQEKSFDGALNQYERLYK